MRGEDLLGSLGAGLQAGSPPHARGRLRTGQENQVVRRITPACAGKTQGQYRLTAPEGDHPRMRGEDFLEILVFYCIVGSPPHARGRHMVAIAHYANRRITPACAGKTQSRASSPSIAWDPPRMRGEDGIRRRGSPPHARGRRRDRRRRRRRRRITPACAGKTPLWSERRRPPFGSPPHARGRLCIVADALYETRITPACAGKT